MPARGARSRSTRVLTFALQHALRPRTRIGACHHSRGSCCRVPSIATRAVCRVRVHADRHGRAGATAVSSWRSSRLARAPPGVDTDVGLAHGHAAGYSRTQSRHRHRHRVRRGWRRCPPCDAYTRRRGLCAGFAVNGSTRHSRVRDRLCRFERFSRSSCWLHGHTRRASCSLVSLGFCTPWSDADIGFGCRFHIAEVGLPGTVNRCLLAVISVIGEIPIHGQCIPSGSNGRRLRLGRDRNEERRGQLSSDAGRYGRSCRNGHSSVPDSAPAARPWSGGLVDRAHDQGRVAGRPTVAQVQGTMTRKEGDRRCAKSRPS